MTETAWLIEFRVEGSGPRYWGKTIEGIGVTAEHFDAIRFARREDAEILIAVNYWSAASAIQHLWDDGKPDYLRPAAYDIEAGRILRGHTKLGCHCRYCKSVLSGKILLNSGEPQR